MKSKQQIEGDTLKAIVASAPPGCIVFVAAKHAHHFRSVPLDGRTYVVEDFRRPWVAHCTDSDGTYQRYDHRNRVHKIGFPTFIERKGKEIVFYTPHKFAASVDNKHLSQRDTTSQATTQAEVRLIPLDRVKQISGFGNSFIHERQDFPKPVRLGTSLRSASRWVESEVIAWVLRLQASRPSASAIS